MRLRNRTLFDVMLGTGLYLLDPIRDHLADRIDDFTDRARDTYNTASGRIDRASRAIRGESSPILGNVTALLVGVGVGVGVGMLLAPASGEQTRDNIANKVQDFGGKVKNRFANEMEAHSTGTYGG